MFIDGQRQHCLDLLHHLHDDTTSYIIIEGDSGLGKTTLINQFKNELLDRDTVIAVDHNSGSLRSDTFLALCKPWGIQDIPDTSSELALVKILQESTKSRALTLLIDNTSIKHKDDVDFLSFLQHVQLEKPCHVILAGPTGLSEQLRHKLTGHHPTFNYQVITLLPLSEQGTGDFVAWLQSNGAPISDTQLAQSDIYQNTGGNPARIIALLSGAQDLVVTTPTRNSPKISSNQFIYGTTAILIVLFIGLMGVSDEPVEISPEAALPEKMTEPLLAVQPELEKVVATEPSIGPSNSPVIASQETLTPADLKPAAPAPQLVQQPKLVTPPGNGFRQENWLLSQNPKHFTWQLVLNRKEQAAQDFIRNNNIAKNAGYYRKFTQNKDWYSVVYGSYPTIKEADAALAALPKPLKLFTPWRRVMGDVHKEIVAYNARTGAEQ